MHFIKSEGLTKGSMQLIDEDRAKALYDHMGPAREISGGSAANTLAGLARLGHKTAFIGQVADDQLGRACSRMTFARAASISIFQRATVRPRRHAAISW